MGEIYMIFSLNSAWKGTNLATVKGNNSYEKGIKMYNFRIKSEMRQRSIVLHMTGNQGWKKCYLSWFRTGCQMLVYLLKKYTKTSTFCHCN
jgi:hypothetical protein